MSRRKQRRRKIKTKEVIKEQLEQNNVSFKVTPRTDGQKAYLRSININKLTMCIGPAGTGKTFLAVARALNGLHSGTYSRIIITRPVVESGESLGFLPGTMEKKLENYLRPIYDEMENFIEPRTVEKWIREHKIEVCPFAFTRGRNFKGVFVLADECQNATAAQLFMLTTRFCKGSKMVLTGDFTQSDLPRFEQGGYKELTEYTIGIPDSQVVKLTTRDIVRDKLVEDIVIAKEEYYAQKQKDADAK